MAEFDSHGTGGINWLHVKVGKTSPSLGNVKPGRARVDFYVEEEEGLIHLTVQGRGARPSPEAAGVFQEIGGQGWPWTGGHIPLLTH